MNYKAYKNPKRVAKVICTKIQIDTKHLTISSSVELTPEQFKMLENKTLNMCFNENILVQRLVLQSSVDKQKNITKQSYLSEMLLKVNKKHDNLNTIIMLAHLLADTHFNVISCNCNIERNCNTIQEVLNEESQPNNSTKDQ